MALGLCVELYSCEDGGDEELGGKFGGGGVECLFEPCGWGGDLRG